MKIQTYVEMSIEAEVDYSPARPAPACQDHDSPRFSDPGDDEMLEYGEMHFVFTRDGVKSRVKIPDALIEHVIDKIDGDVIDQCRDKAVITKDDYAEYMAERER